MNLHINSSVDIPTTLPAFCNIYLIDAEWEDAGSNLTASSCVYHSSHWDIQPWYGCAPLLQCLGRLKSSTLCGTVKWVSAFGLS